MSKQICSCGAALNGHAACWACGVPTTTTTSARAKKTAAKKTGAKKRTAKK